DDRHQERRLDLPEAVEREPGEQREPEGDDEPEARDADQPAAQPLEVDLEAREEEQERQPDEREHLDRLVDAHPPEPGGPDGDAGDDLEDDRREAGGGRGPEQGRGGGRPRRDDHEPGEMKVGHGRWSEQEAPRYRRRSQNCPPGHATPMYRSIDGPAGGPTSQKRSERTSVPGKMRPNGSL